MTQTKPLRRRTFHRFTVLKNRRLDQIEYDLVELAPGHYGHDGHGLTMTSPQVRNVITRRMGAKESDWHHRWVFASAGGRNTSDEGLAAEVLSWLPMDTPPASVPMALLLRYGPDAFEDRWITWFAETLPIRLHNEQVT